MTRNTFLYCFHHPYYLSYFEFWLEALFAEPRKGKREVRSFSFLFSAMRATHSSSPWVVFSERSLGTSLGYLLMNEFQGKAESAALAAPLHLGEWDGRSAESPQCCGRDKGRLCRACPHTHGNMWEGKFGAFLRHLLSSAPPEAVSLQHPLARTRRQMAQSTLPFIFRSLTALCKSQLCS